jgi:hypothetical protein
VSAHIVAHNWLVKTTADELACFDQHRTHRHLTVLRGRTGLQDRLLHPVLVIRGGTLPIQTAWICLRTYA